MAQIKAYLDCINSRTDMAGNRYWAFRYTDIETGKTVFGTISGGESNISCITRIMGYDWKEVIYTRHELPIREFDRLVKGAPYAGCNPETELVPFIKKGLTT
jgi:hypothetical protein